MASSKITLGTQPRKNSGTTIVIKELEQKLAKKNRNSQGAAEFKFTDLTKVSPENEHEGGARQCKTMSEKQLIHENLLQARARWLAQNKERDDSPASGAGEDETTAGDERKAFVQSLDTTKRFCIDADDRGAQESDQIPLRSKRAFSNSFPKNNRIIPRPPKNRPPVFDSKQQQQRGEATFYVPPATTPSSSDSQGQPAAQQKASDKPTKSLVSKKAVKRLFGLAKGKGKNGKQSNSASKLPNTSTTVAAPVKKVGIKKVLSENVLVPRQVSNQQRDDASSSSAKSYQNVFDDPNYAHYFQQHMEIRSNSSSPVDMTRNRKPKPLPRKGAAGSRNSTCSTDQESESTLSPLSRTFSPTARTTSPQSASRMSNHTSTDSLAGPNLDLGDTDQINMIVRQRTRDDLENSFEITQGSQLSGGKKPMLCKTASFNPQGDSSWDPIKRQTTTRQKKLRRAVFSDGDQQDELTDDYIKMNSICLVNHSPSPPPSSQKKISDPGPRLSPARESSPTPSNPTKSLSALPGSSPSGYQGLNVPVDPKRLSAYYLKIISGQTKTVPSATTHTFSPKSQAEENLWTDEEKVGFHIGDTSDAHDHNLALDSDAPQNPGTAKRDRKSVTPPKLFPSQDSENGSSMGTQTLPPSTGQPSPPKARSERKFQYTPVTVDLQGVAAKKRVPSIPKKFKYKAVTLSQTGKPILEEDEPPCSNEESLENRQELTKIPEQPSCEEDTSLNIPSFPKGKHPLVNLSATSFDKNERSFYVNRKSLIELESCKDLPTTMLSTVDTTTGKVIWHEYVEIDEDKLDVMANSMGVAKSAPIPEKLSRLLALPQQLEESVPTLPEQLEESVQNESVPNDSIEPLSDQPQERNSLLESFASSQSSTDGDYIFNLNAPPSVPPRPDNLDVLVDQIKVKTSSGDYSYAVIPEKQLFGKHWMIFKSRPPAKTISEASREKAKDIGTDSPKEKSIEMSLKNPSSTKSAKKEAKLAPPSVPPKTRSLLREQSLSSDIGVTSPPSTSKQQEPYLPPIIVKTKEKKPTLLKGGKEKGSPTFISYIRDQMSTLTPFFNDENSSPEVQTKRLVSPPKPIPYEEHLRKKKMGALFNPYSLADASDFSPKRQKVGNTRKARTKPHHQKKLARQKSHRASGKLGNHHYRSSQRRRQNHMDTAPWNGKLSHGQGGVQKRKKPRGPRQEQIEQLYRESIAAMIMDDELLDESASTNSLLETQDSQVNESSVLDKRADSVLSPEATTSPSGRGLDRILNELGHILKSNECSEEDLLTAIEKQLKITLRKKSTLSPSPATTQLEDAHHNEFIESDESEMLEAEPTDDDKASEEASREASPTQSITTAVKALSVREQKLVKSLQEKKRSYVNLEFADDEDDDDEPAHKDRPKMDRPKSTTYKPRYYNLEYFDEVGNVVSIDNNNDSSDDDFEYSYVHPDQTIEIRGLFRAAQQAKMSKASATTDLQRFKPLNIPKICTNSDELLDVCPVSSIPSNETARSPIPRERSKSSLPSSVRNQLLIPAKRQGRTQSNPPDPDRFKQTTTSDSSSNEESNLDFASGSSSTISMISKQDPEESLHTRAPSVAGAVEENTSSYNLALEMEDLRFSKSVEVPHKVRLADVKEEATEEEKGGRSLSTSSKALQRINAKRKASQSCPTYTNGIGTFTQKGGRLMKVGSDVTIEIPENAIPQGKSQKLRFEVKQSVYDPSIDEESSSFSDSGSIEIESLLEEKKDKRIQLSPIVTVGPSDAVLDCPITIRIPHCLPYRNNSWHLQMLGRAPNGDKEGDERGWCEIANTIGLVQLSTKGSSNKFHKKSTYQMHLDYVQVKTCRLGSFKLVGRPIRNGTYAAKKMVASVFSKVHPNKKSVQFDIFTNNAIEDQSNALEASLTSHGHTPLLKGMPILCFGDGKDMELTLSNDSNTAIPLGTKAIPFGQFWRHNKVGQSHIIFDIETDLVEDDRTLTLKIQQADSKLYHETNFYLPEI